MCCSLEKINTCAIKLNKTSLKPSHQPVLSGTTITISVPSLTSTPFSAITQPVQGSQHPGSTVLGSSSVSWNGRIGRQRDDDWNQTQSSPSIKIYIKKSTKQNITNLIDKTKQAYYSAKIQSSTTCKQLFQNFKTIFGKNISLPLPSTFDSDNLPTEKLPSHPTFHFCSKSLRGSIVHLIKKGCYVWGFVCLRSAAIIAPAQNVLFPELLPAFGHRASLEKGTAYPATSAQHLRERQRKPQQDELPRHRTLPEIRQTETCKHCQQRKRKTKQKPPTHQGKELIKVKNIYYLWQCTGAGIAQMVEHSTEKQGAIQMWVQVPGGARLFFSQSQFPVQTLERKSERENWLSIPIPNVNHLTVSDLSYSLFSLQSY